MIRLRMFVSSYALLFLVLGLRFKSSDLRIACVSLFILGVVAALSIIVGRQRIAPIQVTVKRIDDSGAEVEGYLVSYLFPFIVMSRPGLWELVSYGIMFLVVAVIYVRSDLMRINPTLYLMGYSLMIVEYGQNARRFLISRERPFIDSQISVVEIGDMWFRVNRNGDS